MHHKTKSQTDPWCESEKDGIEPVDGIRRDGGSLFHKWRAACRNKRFVILRYDWTGGWRSDQWWRPCGSSWLNGNKITEVVWSRRLKEFICDRDDCILCDLVHWASEVISESGWHQKTWVLQQRHEQVSFEYDGGNLIGFLEDHNTVNYSMCQ